MRRLLENLYVVRAEFLRFLNRLRSLAALPLLFLRQRKPLESWRVDVVLRKRLLEFLLRVLENAFSVEDFSHRGVHLHVVGIYLERTRYDIVGFLHLVFLQEEVGIEVDCLNPPRLRAERPLVAGKRLPRLADCLVAFCDVQLDDGMVRVDFQPVLICDDSLLVVSLKRVDCAEMVEREDVARIFVDYVLEAVDGRFVLSHLPVREAEAV